jgi:hypothetical protein
MYRDRWIERGREVCYAVNLYIYVGGFGEFGMKALIVKCTK